MKTFLCSVIVAISCAVSLLGQTPRTKLPVYVGPQTRDGFVDVDRGILDSIKDIKNALRGSRPFRVVERPEEATILLTVVALGSGCEEHCEGCDGMVRGESFVTRSTTGSSLMASRRPRWGWTTLAVNPSAPAPVQGRRKP